MLLRIGDPLVDAISARVASEPWLRLRPAQRDEPEGPLVVETKKQPTSLGIQSSASQCMFAAVCGLTATWRVRSRRAGSPAGTPERRRSRATVRALVRDRRWCSEQRAAGKPYILSPTTPDRDSIRTPPHAPTTADHRLDRTRPAGPCCSEDRHTPVRFTKTPKRAEVRLTLRRHTPDAGPVGIAAHVVTEAVDGPLPLPDAAADAEPRGLRQVALRAQVAEPQSLRRLRACG